MAKFSVAVFNLDNTLVKTEPAAKEAYRQAIYYLAKQHGLHNKRDKLFNHWKRIVTKLLGEKKPQLRRFSYSLKKLMEEHKIPETYYPQALHTYERVMLENLEPTPGAKDLFKSLKEEGLKIAVVSGSDRSETIKKLKAGKLFQYVDCIVSSTDVDTMKPDEVFFKTVSKECGVKFKQMIVISDSLIEDLNIAKKLGCHTLHLRPFSPLHQVRESVV